MRESIYPTNPLKSWFTTVLSLICLCSSIACQGQQKKSNMSETTKNPLLCSPETGLCEIPGAKDSSASPFITIQEKPLKMVYFTDPICSSCWGIEPQLRRLKLEYGQFIEIEYRMGGLLPSWDIYNSGGISKPSDVAHHWDEVSGHYDMPIDGDVWLEDPLPSSYPPSIAFKAAQMQDGHKAILFLRRIREMVFMEKKNITRWEHLSAAAVAVGLDAAQLENDYKSAAKTAFEADLALARQMGVRGFPSVFISDTKGQQLFVYGSKPYTAYTEALKKLLPGIQPKTYDNSLETLLLYYPTLTVKEFSLLSGQERNAAAAALQQAQKAGKLKALHCKNGDLYFQNRN